MQKALDLIEAGSFPHRHSHVCVVVDEASAAEVELSFFDYQRQAYIGESGLSPRPFFFLARKRTLAEGRAGYVVGPEVTRFLRRDARFGVASREGRLGDVRCKVRTYVEAKEGALPVEFAVSRQDRSQRERPEISIDASSSPRSSAPFAMSISAGSMEPSAKPGLDVSIALEKRQEEPAGLGMTVAFDGRQGEETATGAGAQTETSREPMASSAPEAAATTERTTPRAERDEFSRMWVAAPLAIVSPILMLALTQPDTSRSYS